MFITLLKKPLALLLIFLITFALPLTSFADPGEEVRDNPYLLEKRDGNSAAIELDDHGFKLTDNKYANNNQERVGTDVYGNPLYVSHSRSGNQHTWTLLDEYGNQVGVVETQNGSGEATVFLEEGIVVIIRAQDSNEYLYWEVTGDGVQTFTLNAHSNDFWLSCAEFDPAPDPVGALTVTKLVNGEFPDERLAYDFELLQMGEAYETFSLDSTNDFTVVIEDLLFSEYILREVFDMSDPDLILPSVVKMTWGSAAVAAHQMTFGIDESNETVFIEVDNQYENEDEDPLDPPPVDETGTLIISKVVLGGLKTQDTGDFFVVLSKDSERVGDVITIHTQFGVGAVKIKDLEIPGVYKVEEVMNAEGDPIVDAEAFGYTVSYRAGLEKTQEVTFGEQGGAALFTVINKPVGAQEDPDDQEKPVISIGIEKKVWDGEKWADTAAFKAISAGSSVEVRYRVIVTAVPEEEEQVFAFAVQISDALATDAWFEEDFGGEFILSNEEPVFTWEYTLSFTANAAPYVNTAIIDDYDDDVHSVTVEKDRDDAQVTVTDPPGGGGGGDDGDSGYPPGPGGYGGPGSPPGGDGDSPDERDTTSPPLTFFSVPDADIPLSPMPEEEYEIIDEDEIPRSNLPQTGDAGNAGRGIIGFITAFSSLGAAGATLFKKEKRG